MPYPECDKYDCMECPRRDDCVDVVIEEEYNEGPAVFDYFEQRLNDMERRLYELQQFKESIERMLSAMTKAYEDQGDN